MKKNIFFFICLVAATCILSGCGTTPQSHFYQLQPRKNAALNLCPVPKGERYSITMQPTEIASYLERPQLVVKEEDGSFSVMELHRWAGDLEEDVYFVLIADVGAEVIQQNIDMKSWPAKEADVTIATYIYRFDCLRNGDCYLAARWTIRYKDEKDHSQSKSYIKEFYKKAEAEKGYVDLVKGLNALLHDFAKEIIKTLPE